MNFLDNASSALCFGIANQGRAQTSVLSRRPWTSRAKSASGQTATRAKSITSLNKGLINFQGEVLFTSRDYELNSTVTNRVIEILDDGSIIDRCVPYEEYIESKSKR